MIQPSREYQPKAACLDEDSIIENGRPVGVYLPKDPQRRHRLLVALGLRKDK